jgi:hypothetical protein
VSRFTPTGRPYRRLRKAFLATFTICWICGHDLADTIDHGIAASTAPSLAMDVSLWRPAHGVKGCPTCGRRCNQERGTGPGLPQTRRSRRW